MKKINRFKSLTLILISLFSVMLFCSVKQKNIEPENVNAYYYETSDSYLKDLTLNPDTIGSKFNLADYYPITSENQTNSSLCWIYSSMKALETAFMLQQDEYYNFSEVATAYLAYSSGIENGENASFNIGGNFELFVSSYQDDGLVLESDFSNTEFISIYDNKNAYDYYSQVKDLTTKEYNSYIKPYQVCSNSYFVGLARSAKIEVIKRFVNRYGALYTGIQADSDYGCFYRDSSDAVNSMGIYNYYSYTITSHVGTSGYYKIPDNHAVTIVGWNDDISIGAEKGAFVAVNSWGLENNSYTFFYIPYSYDFIYNFVSGFIIEEPKTQNIEIIDSGNSTFTTDILSGSNLIRNYFCYDDEINITYKLALSSLENIKVEVTGGNKTFTGDFNITFDNSKKTVNIVLVKSSEFYGGYYTLNFYNGDELFGKKSLFVYSANEIGYFKLTTEITGENNRVEYNPEYWALNNTFLNANNVETLRLAGVRDSYYMFFNLSNISNYETLSKSASFADMKDFKLEISDISVISSTNSEALNYSSQELQGLISIESKNIQADLFKIKIGDSIGLKKFYNCLIKFKITTGSLLYDNCEREYYFNLFISENPNAQTRGMFSITYNLDGGDNDNRNITKFPSFTNLDANMPEIELYQPTKVGSIFVGWYINEDFSGDEVTKIDSSLTTHIKLYAKWSEISVDYFDISLTLTEIKNYSGQSKQLEDGIVYGDSLKLTFELTKKQELDKYPNYKVYYYFYGMDVESGYLDGIRKQFDLVFPTLKAGNRTFKVKIVMYVTSSLMVTKETSLNLNIEKKFIEFEFSNLKKEYNGEIQYPSVTVDGVYVEDLENKNPSDLVTLFCAKDSKNAGTYTYTISKFFNSNYYYDEDTSCSFVIEQRELQVNWLEYNQTYDGREHAPEYTLENIIAGDTVSLSYNISQFKNAGHYSISVLSVSNSNYKVSANQSFEFDILPAKIRIVINNVTDRVQTLPARRVLPTYTIYGDYYTKDDVQINIVSQALNVTRSGVYEISCTIGSSNYELAEFGNESNNSKKAYYTLTGYYNVYYQLSNGKQYVERVEEGSKPVGVTKDNFDAPKFSKITYSDDFVVTGEDLYVKVTLTDYSGAVYTAIFLVIFGMVCLIFFIKNRGSKVR